MAACSSPSSSSLTPWRFIELMHSMTTRAPTRACTPSTDDTDRTTRSGSGTGSSPRRKGVRTSRSPLNQSLMRAASYVVPTARMSEPKRIASSASRSWPKPYPLPLQTGTMPGNWSITDFWCARQRAVSTYRESAMAGPGPFWWLR